MLRNKRTVLEIIFISVIVLTLLFVFSRSAKSKEESSAESDAVGDVVEEIIPDDAPGKDFVVINIRKIAHFVEFAILGIEIAVYVLLLHKRRLFIAASYPVGLIFAFLDETVQVFSRRGPSITDVWIDFIGFALFSSLVYVIYLAVRLIAGLRRHSVKGGSSNG